MIWKSCWWLCGPVWFPLPAFHEATSVQSARSAAYCTPITEKVRGAISQPKSCHAQGVPVDFLTRNEQFVSASAQRMPGQVQPDSPSPTAPSLLHAFTC